MWEEEPHPGWEDPFYLALSLSFEMEVPDAWKVMFWLITAA